MSIWYGEGPYNSGPLSPEEAFLARRQEGGMSAFAGGAAVDSWGAAGNATETDATSSPITDEDGIGFQQDTSAVINNEASLLNQLSGPELGMNPILMAKFSLVQLTDCRFFVGFMNASISQIVSNDDGGTAQYAGVQFSSTRGGGDTNFQIMSGDGIPANQEITDSLVVADDEVYSLRVKLNAIAASARMVLRDKRGILLRDVTHSTSIPDATQPLRWGMGVETLVGGVKSYVFYDAKILIPGLEV